MFKKEELLKRMDKMVNRFILITTRFIETSASPYGLLNSLKGNPTAKLHLSYDFEYFALTKSLKSLIAIRDLLKSGHNEDAIILLRSIFENYLSCRFYNENPEEADEFIRNPIRLSMAFYNVNSSGEIVNRDNQVQGEIRNPSAFKLGKDKGYFFVFYDILSQFAHCNFSIYDCYLDNEYSYVVDKVNYEVEARLFTLFVFSKLFEHVVTVEGEEFYNIVFKRSCYKLVDDSQKFIREVFTTLIEEINNTQSEFNKHKDKRLKNMYKDMLKSLNEELGSIKKD